MTKYDITYLLNDKDLHEIFGENIQIIKSDSIDFIYESLEYMKNCYFYTYGTVRCMKRGNEFIIEVSDAEFVIIYDDNDRKLYLFCINYIDDKILSSIKKSSGTMIYLLNIPSLNRTPRKDYKILLSNGAVRVMTDSVIPNIHFKEIEVEE